MDWNLRQYRIQVAAYALYRRAIGQLWDHAVISESGKHWRVTKSIRGIGVRLFGKTFWLTVPMVIEREPADEPNRSRFRDTRQ